MSSQMGKSWIGSALLFKNEGRMSSLNPDDAVACRREEGKSQMRVVGPMKWELESPWFAITEIAVAVGTPCFLR